MESDRMKETVKWDVDAFLQAHYELGNDSQASPEPEPSIEDRFDGWIRLIDQ